MVYLFNFRYFVICLLLHFQLCLVTYALYTAQALYKHRIGFQGWASVPIWGTLTGTFRITPRAQSVLNSLGVFLLYRNTSWVSWVSCGLMWMWSHLPRWHSAPRALDPLNHAKRRPGTGRLWFLSNCPERLGYIWNRKVWSLMAGVSKMTATWIHRIATADVQFLRWLPAKASEVDTCHRVAEDQRKFSHVCWWYSGLHCRNVLRNFAYTVWGHMYMQVSTHIMRSLPQPWRNLQCMYIYIQFYIYIYMHNIHYIYIQYFIYIYT